MGKRAFIKVNGSVAATRISIKLRKRFARCHM